MLQLLRSFRVACPEITYLPGDQPIAEAYVQEAFVSLCDLPLGTEIVLMFGGDQEVVFLVVEEDGQQRLALKHQADHLVTNTTGLWDRFRGWTKTAYNNLLF